MMVPLKIAIERKSSAWNHDNNCWSFPIFHVTYVIQSKLRTINLRE